MGISPLLAKEESIPLDQVPGPVLDAVKAKFPGVKITAASKEKEDGKEIIEVAFTYKDSKYEVESTPQGELQAIDKIITGDEMPAKVAKALKEKYPKAKYQEIEEVTKDNKVVYHEIELTTAEGQSMQVQVDPAGKILHEEKKKGGEEKD